MDTVRFAKIVESCGKPDTHLLLMDPGKDKALQAAIKSHRVMTVHQESGSTKTDYGTVGFEEGTSRQFLLFPKTLKPFADKRVIGIKYDLLESVAVPEKDHTPTPVAGQAPEQTGAKAHKEIDNEPPKTIDDQASKVIPKSEARKKKAPAGVEGRERQEKAPPDKLLEFPKPESSQEVSDHSDELEELKRRVREAMDALEQGKQVAAFNLLKRIVEG